MHLINSLALGGCSCNPRLVIFKLLSEINIHSIPCAITLMWIPQDLTDDKWTLASVMAWCHQATSHYLSQRGPRALIQYKDVILRSMTNGITGPQWVALPHWLLITAASGLTCHCAAHHGDSGGAGVLGRGFIILIGRWRWRLQETRWSWFTHWCLGDVDSGCNLRAIFKHVSSINIMSISCETDLRRMPKKPFDGKSTLGQVMA